MADLFVSYSREDKARAEEVVRLLEDYGWDVFWDQETRSGDALAEGARRGTHQGALSGGALDHDLDRQPLGPHRGLRGAAERKIGAGAARQGPASARIPADADVRPDRLERRPRRRATGASAGRSDGTCESAWFSWRVRPVHQARRSPTLQRDMPAATLPNAVSAASGEPDAQPATIVPRPPADHDAASSSQVSLSTTGSSRGVMLGLGVTAAVAAVAWLISVVDFSPGADSAEPTKSVAATPSAPSTSVAAPRLLLRSHRPPCRHPPLRQLRSPRVRCRRRRFPNLQPNSRRKSCGRLVAWRSKKSFNDRPDNGDRARPSSQ